MTGTTWDSLFNGRPELVRKALYGSVLIQDYSASNAFATYSPFDSTTGLLTSTLLTSDGWTDLGYLDENGVQFTPTYSVADTTTWQSRQALRADVTADTEQAMVTALQSSPLTDVLYNSLPLSAAGSLGASGYKIAKPKVPQIVYRSVLFLGVDGAAGSYEFVAKLYPRCLMIKPDKQAWQAKTEIQVPLTFQAYPDAVSGFTVETYREGPGWRSRGIPSGVAPLVITPSATTLGVSWTAATVPSGAPALSGYTVTVNKVSDGSAAAGSPFAVAAGTTTKSVTGLTTGQPYNVSVVAANSNGSGPAATGVGTPT
jgi:hypothetical protein